MAVRRDKKKVLNAPADIVTQAIRTVLRNGHLFWKYSKTEEDHKGLLIKTVIKPVFYPLVLSTKMTIEIESINSKTSVTVSTYSQECIYGDIFGIYNRYINRFLVTLSKTASGAATGTSIKK